MSNYSNNSFFKIGKLPILTWLGKISYGLYVTHMIALNIIFAIFTNEAEFVLLKNLLTIILTILLSYVSYITIEKYFLSLKNKFSYESDKTSL
jgi:peptidoglycan/LPS O-acetylase OafA/YrhL